MRCSRSVSALLMWATATSAAPTSSPLGCVAPSTRQEWRTLTPESQANYMDAIKCLITKPSRLGLNTTLYDDFPYIHSQLNLQIHFVAQFLPWHRLFVHAYESALNECGYIGAMPYWDWTQDAGKLLFSSVVADFGGNGLYGGYTSPSRPNPLVSCVTSGPVANRTMEYYNGVLHPHCLNRQINNGTGSVPEAFWFESFYTPAAVDNITITSLDFETYTYELENNPHGAIHNALGGDMGPSTSPNDPLFMLHHSMIDRLWWLWQGRDSPARQSDFGGKRLDGSNATIEDVMPYMGLIDDATVQSVMSTETDLLCYNYA